MAAVIVVTACGHDPERTSQGALTITADRMSFHAIARGPAARPGRLTVLFLHGASFNADVWDKTGLLDRIARSGSRAVAVDLPGYGATPSTDRAPAAVLAALVREVGAPADVVVVSPSMSGRYSLAMLAERPDVHLGGFVPVAPIGTEDFRRPPGAPAIPTLAVWGADDDVVPRSGASALRRQLPGAQILVIPGAGHAAYVDQPEGFGAALVAFAASIRHQR